MVLTERLSAGGAAPRQHRKRRANDTAERALGDARQVPGEDSVIEKLSGAIAPSNAQEPMAIQIFGTGRRDFRGGDHQQRLQLRIERPDLFLPDKKLSDSGDGISRLVLSAINDDQGAQLASFVVRGRIGFRRRQKSGDEKHGEAGGGGEPVIPQAERQNHKSRASESEEDAEDQPGLLVAANADEFGNQQNEGEKSAESEVAQPHGGFAGGRRHWARGLAHISSLLLEE